MNLNLKFKDIWAHMSCDCHIERHKSKDWDVGLIAHQE